MKKVIGTAVIIGALLVPAISAEAEAAPYLGIGEAQGALGRELHRSFEYGAETGSLLAYCGRRSRALVRCDILFSDWDGDAWCGTAKIRETSRKYWISWRVNTYRCDRF